MDFSRFRVRLSFVAALLMFGSIVPDAALADRPPTRAGARRTSSTARVTAWGTIHRPAARTQRVSEERAGGQDEGSTPTSNLLIGRPTRFAPIPLIEHEELRSLISTEHSTRMLRPAAPHFPQSDKPRIHLEQLNAERIHIRRRIERSAVMIDTGVGTGSGYVGTTRGWVWTNHHVIDEMGPGGLFIVTSRGRRVPALLIDSDPGLDLALLQPLEPLGLPALPLQRKVLVSEEVFAHGAPLGMQGTWTQGVVGRLEQSNETGVLRRMVQFDAIIGPGNSGGPLVNVLGEVVGLNTQMLAVQGASWGFAVQARTMHQFLKDVEARLEGRAPNRPPSLPHGEADLDTDESQDVPDDES